VEVSIVCSSQVICVNPRVELWVKITTQLSLCIIIKFGSRVW